MRTTKHFFKKGVGIISVMLFYSSLAFGATIHVPDDFSNIQDAINEASNGDTVLVADGTYSGWGNINICFTGKAITVKSENGPAACIIDCENINRGFMFNDGESAEAVLSGFTIKNGSMPGWRGGGIAINNNSNPTIQDCIITDCEAGAGGGIYIDDYSDPTIHNCIITRNTADGPGGGMLIMDFSSPVIDSCIIADNITNDSGAGMHLWQASPLITNCIFADNTSNVYGSGINVNTSSPVINYCTFSGNSTVDNTWWGGAAITIMWESEPLIQNSIVWGNAPDEIIDVFGIALVTVTDSCVEGGYTGGTNILTDPPEFIDAANGDYHISDTSPCINRGTDDNAPDTDIDGEPRPQCDGDDIGYDLGADEVTDVSGDSDNDDLTDCEEIALGTNPVNPDSDTDTLPDGWEYAHGLDPTIEDSDNDGISDADEDTDMDSLTNGQEYALGTNPNDADSDDDGLDDGIEDANHNGVVDAGETNPNNPDTDGDGLFDGEEDANHNGVVDAGETDPLQWSSDEDLMPDGWEVQYGLDPLADDANGDLDQDGISNYDEYLAGTRPDSRVRWKFDTRGAIWSTPAISPGGLIYAGSQNGLHALFPDGSLNWEIAGFGDSLLIASPLLVGENIYFGTLFGNFYSLTVNGGINWEFVCGVVDSSAAVGYDGTIYFGSEDGNLYAVDPSGTDQESLGKWIFPTGDMIVSSPAIGSDGTIYVGSVDDKLYAINPDGSLRWEFNAGDDIYSSPAIGFDGTVYIGANNGKVYAVTPSIVEGVPTGVLKWEFQTGASISSSASIAPDGTVYIGAEDGYLYAIDPDTGEGAGAGWPFPAGPVLLSTPTVGSDGTIYVGNINGDLHAVNPDGSSKWVCDVSNQPIVSSPVIAPDGTIYVGSFDRSFYAIEGDANNIAVTPWPKFRHDTTNSGKFTRPVISLIGENPATVTEGDVYSDAGATASDLFGNDITGSIETDIQVNTAIPGTYVVTYDVTDSGGNAAEQVTRTVVVEPAPVKPVITVLGANPVMVEACGTYTDAGATASGVDGDLTAYIYTNNPVDPGVPAVYTVTYDVVDAHGTRADQATRTVIVEDTTAPLITMLGTDPVTFEACSGTYIDDGATASDNCSGTGSGIIVNNPVDSCVPGTYTVTYNVADAGGNAAAQAERTINVVDTTAPVIALNGSLSMDHEAGMEYTDPGYSATDAVDGVITDRVVMTGDDFDVSVPGGPYTITFYVADSAGNPATVQRTVTVVDTTPPEITLAGGGTVDLEVGTPYTDAGAEAWDMVDGDLSGDITVSGDVFDTNSPGGPYTIIYEVTDTAGNYAEAERVVNVLNYPTELEQVHLEEINRARLDPQAEADRLLGGDLNEGLDPGTISSDPKQPLAFNSALLGIARYHSEDMMADPQYLNSTSPGGETIEDRIISAGFQYCYPLPMENIGWEVEPYTVDAVQAMLDIHELLFIDDFVDGRWNRLVMLLPYFKEVGLGVAQGPDTTYPVLNWVKLTYDLISDYNNPASADKVFVTGVVYDDTYSDGKYTYGEGVENVDIIIIDPYQGSEIGRTKTGVSGGYRVPVPEGYYSCAVCAVLPGETGVLWDTYEIQGENIKVDFILSDFEELLPAVEFNSSPSVISIGGSAELSWHVDNASSCEIDNGIGSVASTGSILVSPTTETTYTLTVHGTGGDGTAEVTVSFWRPNVSIAAAPARISQGGSSTLTWTSVNAESCSIDQGIGSVSLNGTTTVNPTATTAYTITASGPGGVTTKTATVMLPVPGVELTASPNVIDFGDSSTLEWQTADVATCEIDNGIGSVGVNGSVSVSPTETTTYTLTATGPNGTTTRSVTVSMWQPVVTLSADRFEIAPGGSATLTWTATNADSCEMDNGIGSVDVNGSVTVFPMETTTYTLTATGPGGSATSAITIEVGLPIALGVTTPEDNASISRPDIMVEGTFSNALNLENGITVNGIVAMVYGNHFVANHVPLESGVNTITITLTDADGHVRETTRTVTADTSGDYITINANPESGLPPFETSLSIDGSFSISSSTVTPSDASVVFLSSAADEYSVRITPEGFCYFTAEVENEGVTYTDTVAVAVNDRTELDALLNMKWDGMKTALSDGNVEAAIACFHPGSQEDYQAIFELLNEDAGKLASIASGMRDVQMVDAWDTTAQYRIKREELIQGTIYDITYYIYFMKDAGGLWKIESF